MKRKILQATVVGDADMYYPPAVHAAYSMVCVVQGFEKQTMQCSTISFKAF